MKKYMGALCLFLCMVLLASCSFHKKDPLHLGVNAVITDIDAENKVITVSGCDREDFLGDACRIDCSEVPLIYCNYDTQEVKTISFDDLQVEDEILLSIRHSEIEAFQNADNGENTIRVEQLQLGTQRIP